MRAVNRREYQRVEREAIAEIDPELHELLSEEPTCRECGCSDSLACEQGCWWVEDDLCSACAADGDDDEDVAY